MDFINKHYEKLILLAVLIIFVIGMIFVLGTFDKTSEVKDSDLRIPTRSADYQGTASGEKKISEVWNSSNFNWLRAKSRDAKAMRVFYSDLVAFDTLANCPHCKKLIPLSVFSGNKCPNEECGKVLETPKRPKYRIHQITADDSDGDGMRDEDETKYGLDKTNPRDAQYDKDGDGFSNYFEIENQTDPRLPGSRPPLWKRLRLFSIARVELPVGLKAVTDYGSKKMEDWDCQINIKNIDRKTGRYKINKRTKQISVSTRIIRVGGELDIQGRMYRLVKIDRIIKTSAVIASSKGKKNEETKDKYVDESIAYFTEILPEGSNLAPDKIKMQVGKPAYSSDERPIMVDDGLLPEDREKSEHTICFAPGQSFQMGDRRTGYEKYTVFSFDSTAKTVVLHREKTRAKRTRRRGKAAAEVAEKEDLSKDIKGQPMIVTVEGGIPEESRIIPTEIVTPNTTVSSEI